MKKVITLVLIVCLMFTGCSTKDTPTYETEVNTQTANSEETKTKSEIESKTESEMDSEIDDTIKAIGEVEVDKGLLTIEIVIPAEYMEGTSQEDLDTSSLESGFISATLNADGSATYVMTKESV